MLVQAARFISLIIILVFTSFSCKKNVVAYDMHYGYFDLTKGRYIDYDVIEIQHDVSQALKHDTSRYQLRTIIGDTLLDNEGRIAKLYLRFKRASSDDSWVLEDTWTAIIVNNRAELVEENQRVIKMVFEPKESKVWNPNSFNSFPELTASYRNIHQGLTIGSLSFDSTLVVEQQDFLSLIDYSRKYEVYAKGIGMVKKYYKDLVINGFDTLNIKSGTELFYNCIGYGME